MTTLTNFFKESNSTMGVFYPKHYIIATFPTFAITEEAERVLRRAGFPDGEVVAVPASEILKYFVEFRSETGLSSGVMTALSRAFGTEQAFADADADFAREGAGFLAVHCPDQAQADRIAGMMKPFLPKAMHWYESGGVQCLI